MKLTKTDLNKYKIRKQKNGNYKIIANQELPKKAVQFINKYRKYKNTYNFKIKYYYDEDDKIHYTVEFMVILN